MMNGTARHLLSNAPDRAYRQLVEHAQDIIYFCDRLGRITFANRAATKLLGYDVAEMIGRHPLLFVDPQFGDEVRTYYAQALERDLADDCKELPVLCADGSRVWLSQHLQKRFEDGEFVGFQAIARDVSGRIRIQEDLAEQKHRLQLLYELISRRTEDLRPHFEEALHLATRLLGMDVGLLSRIEGRSYTVEFCYAPEIDLSAGDRFSLGNTYCSIAVAAKDLLAISQTRLSPQQRHPCSARFALESYVGMPIYVFDQLYGTLNFTAREPRPMPFSMQDKDFVRMLGAWISSALENRKAISDLTSSEKKYRSSFDHAAIGKAHVSRDGRWLQINQAFCGIVGYSEEELLGRSVVEITHPEDGDIYFSYAEALLSHRVSSYSIEKRYVKRDGAIVWVLLTVSAASDEYDEVSYFLAEAQDISAQKELEQQLIQQAQHDSLTGLANRSVFMARLSEELSWCRNDPSKLLAVLFMDFDRFKMVNDSLGHTYGDRLLVIVAERIKSALREADLFARLGGDEFGVLLPGMTHEQEASEVAERIQDVLRDPVDLQDHEVFPSASIGIVITDGSYAKPEDLLRDADTAMYQAKEDDGPRYRIFTHKMHELAAKRLRMDTELRRAVDNNEFFPYYQPIVDLTSGDLVGFEALARWRHPVKGIVSPSTFVAHAEEIGLVTQIDRQIIGHVCRQIRSWQDELGECPNLVVHVNCSAHHLLDASLARHLAGFLDETGIDPSSLMIELTESVFIEDLERAAREIQRLKSFGVHTCVDDFGTGYSSLHALHTLPIDSLKIGREFLASLRRAGRQRRIVQTVLDIAHRLEMTVVAEGVETPYHLESLRRLKCSFGQGYLFSAPLPAFEARALVGRPAPWEHHWAAADGKNFHLLMQ